MKSIRKRGVLKKKNRDKILYDLKHNKSLFLMLLVPCIITLIFSYFPLYGLQIAFRDYNPIGDIWESPWVGLKHFKHFFEYYGLKDLVANTLILNLYELAASPVPVVFALLLHYMPSKKMQSVIRQISIMPNFISTVVLCGLILKFFTSGGLFDIIMQFFGFDSINYLAEPDEFRSIYVWSGVWRSVGYSSIIYSAALLSVPNNQHEAAMLDGANLIQRMLKVDLPYLLPLYGVNLMMSFGSILNSNYTKLLMLQNPINLSKSQVLSTYTYEIAFEGIAPQYSMATAIGIITGVVNLILLLIVKKLVGRWTSRDET